MESIDIGVLIAQIINCLILIGLFYYLFVSYFLSIIEERKKLHARLLAIESEQVSILSNAKLERENIILAAKKEVSLILKDGDIIAHKRADGIIASAQNQADHFLENEKRVFEKEKIFVLEQLKTKIIDISLKINEKILGGKSADKNFIESEVEKLGKITL